MRYILVPFFVFLWWQAVEYFDTKVVTTAFTGEITAANCIATGESGDRTECLATVKVGNDHTRVTFGYLVVEGDRVSKACTEYRH